MTDITLRINARDYALQVADDELLIDVLRERLMLYGTKEGCGTGECGACTVLADGLAMNACLLYAVRLEGCEIVTVEGVGKIDQLTRLQELFVEQAAFQCGFCAPGVVISASALLRKNPKPTELEIREGIAGNVCRCTGYTGMVKAITQASQES